MGRRRNHEADNQDFKMKGTNVKAATYPSSVMTSWQVRASVFRELVFLSVGVGSFSSGVGVEMKACSTPPWSSLMPLPWNENNLNNAPKASDGERRRCAALRTTSKTASIHISMPRWRSWLIKKTYLATQNIHLYEIYLTNINKKNANQHLKKLLHNLYNSTPPIGSSVNNVVLEALHPLMWIQTWRALTSRDKQGLWHPRIN